MTIAQVAKELGMKKGRVVSWIERGALPPPSFTDNNGVRYFDLEWLRNYVTAKYGKHRAISFVVQQAVV